MKVLLDLKPLQGENSSSEIKKVTFELSKRMLVNLENPVGLLSDLNPKRGIWIKEEFKKINSRMQFEVLVLEYFNNYLDTFYKSMTTKSFVPYELLLEWNVSQINPDIFLIFSFFEWDNVTSIGKLNKTWKNFVIAYDLIPYIFKEQYLSNEHFKAWYMYKLEEFKKADFFFAISEQTKSDLINLLDIPEAKTKVIPLGCDEIFKPLKEKELNKAREELKEMNIIKDFILYVPSGFDLRKNIEGLIKAYSLLDKGLRKKYLLIIASKIDETNLEKLKCYAKNLGLTEDVIFTGYVSEETLVKLYNLCSLFVHPSFYEGFGLPVLEAARCGAPVICSNNSALKDIIQKKEALFNPYNPEDIAEKITFTLVDPNYKKFLVENAKKQAKRYSWDKAIEIILETLDEVKTCEETF